MAAQAWVAAEARVGGEPRHSLSIRVLTLSSSAPVALAALAIRMADQAPSPLAEELPQLEEAEAEGGSVMALLVDLAEVQVAGRVTTIRAGRVAREMQAVIQSTQQAALAAVEPEPPDRVTPTTTEVPVDQEVHRQSPDRRPRMRAAAAVGEITAVVLAAPVVEARHRTPEL